MGFHPTVIVTENLLLKRLEISSPQAKPVDNYILYPFSYRATQSMIKIYIYIYILISEYDFTRNVVMVIGIAIDKIYIIHDMVNKLLITKISLAKTLMFSML